ncbi:MAG: Lrp/AsnC family transcriptional regulator [Rhizobiales bacterium]|nr:Lrp/AsnC family transcriptional regulator [Hyphomicrobiales bacterium]NRB15141.1 Lrp/AsnC family transcriptional regulator [Hyphomicrobiales bacterium]
MAHLKMDRIFIKILSILQKNGRISNADLSEQINLSASPCHQRMRKLEKSGIIKGYLARIDLGKLRHHDTVIAEVTLNSHNMESFAQFEQFARSHSRIVECFKVSGAFDYFVRFVCKDMEEYTNLSDEILSQTNAATVKSFVVLQHVKEFNGYPLDELVEDQPEYIE